MPTPAQTEVPVRMRRLTVAQIELFNETLWPTSDEIRGMIEAICRRKTWTRSFLAALLRIGPTDLRAYELGLKQAPGSVVVLIWLFHTMDSAPEKAFSVLHMATFGKLEAKLPHYTFLKAHKPNAEIVEDLKACVASKYKLPPGRQTVRLLAEKLNITRAHCLHLCKRAGYKLIDGRKTKYRKRIVPALLRPDSVWITVDWNRPVKEIAEKLGVAVSTVERVRQTFWRMPRNSLSRHLSACGIDPHGHAFEPILNPPIYIEQRTKRWQEKQKRKVAASKNNIPAESSLTAAK